MSRVKSLVWYTKVQKENLNDWIEKYPTYKANQVHFFLHNWKDKMKNKKEHYEPPDYSLALEKVSLFDIVGFTHELKEFVKKIENYLGWDSLELESHNLTPKDQKYSWEPYQEKRMFELLEPEITFYNQIREMARDTK